MNQFCHKGSSRNETEMVGVCELCAVMIDRYHVGLQVRLKWCY